MAGCLSGQSPQQSMPGQQVGDRSNARAPSPLTLLGDALERSDTVLQAFDFDSLLPQDDNKPPRRPRPNIKMLKAQPASNSASTGRCRSCNKINTLQWRRGPHGEGTLCSHCGHRFAELERKRKAQRSHTPSYARNLQTPARPTTRTHLTPEAGGNSSTQSTSSERELEAKKERTKDMHVTIKRKEAALAKALATEDRRTRQKQLREAEREAERAFKKAQQLYRRPLEGVD
ncbi:hypothetical protein DL770_000985 [Monosporascus sp. CRB-9-2]|nr:hypothetical protein DL770_000985 [Monosporascus sp. CRB-9-2]